MCGIAGVLCADRPLAERAVRAMNRAQARRGPDDEGVELLRAPAGTLALGHRRLSILDLSPAGHQPMRNPATGDWIVYNGEVYNYPELRRELEGTGAEFRSHCDTEAILHAYARWGEACFERLEGMFAIALYDARAQRLVLARDPLGIKPLYYAATSGALVFGSSIRAIRASGMVSGDVDRRALAGLLAYGAVQGPLTLLSQVRLLDPGVSLAIDLAAIPGDVSGLRPRRFWHFPEPLEERDRGEAVARVRELLAHAMQSHLLSDVPVGIFLSSGLDSTAVATFCARAEPGAVNTFTVSLAGNPDLDENPLAEATARLLGARHRSIVLTEAEIRTRAAQWLDSVDQPSVDGLNTYIVSGAVRECGIRVALSGLGGDEVFGGYSGFRQLPRVARFGALVRCVPAALRGKMADVLSMRAAPAQRRKAREMAMSRLDLASLVLRRRRLFSDEEIGALGLDRVALGLDENYLPPEADPWQDIAGRDPESVVGALETRFYMGNMLLRDSDVFGMAHGLEIRVPFLDRRLTDYVFALPGRWRVMRDGVNKPLLADALGADLRAGLARRPKTGFSLAYADWMRGPLRAKCEDLVGTLTQAGILDGGFVRRTWDEFLSSAGGPIWSRAWMLGLLGAWLRPR